MDKRPGISLAVYGRTDVGLIREHNEDNFLIADLAKDTRTNDVPKALEIPVVDKGSLLLVCDGMGGAAAGEVASQMAVESITASMVAAQPHSRDEFARHLRRAIEDANDKIYAQSRDNQSERGMGTTCTVVALHEESLVIGQIGDSRCYVMRAGRLAMVTKDQSLAWQLIEAGAMTQEEAKAFEHANIILQALGVQERVDVVLSQLALRQGDVILVCSDGLHGPVSDEEIGNILRSETDLKRAGDQLIARALEHEGPDNVTIVIGRVDGDAIPPPGADEKVQWTAYDPGQDPIEAAQPRSLQTDKETMEVGLPRDSVPTDDATIKTLPETPRPKAAAALAPASESGSVLAFVVLTLVAALAAGLFLHFDRSRELLREQEGLNGAPSGASDGDKK